MGKVRIGVVGVGGRMGQMLVRAICDTGQAVLCGATERAGHPWVGQDLGRVLDPAAEGVIVTDDPIEMFAGAQAVLDFTAPAATVAHAELAAQARAALVVGTTGLSDSDLAALAAAARHAPIVRAGNFSLGVNLLSVLARTVARSLGVDYDIEIVEMHHRHKVDAPSGTALMLGEAAAQGRGVALPDVAERGRDGITGARAPGAIGFAALRGGDVVGDHSVIFAGPGERVTLTHQASDRLVFARGAVRAALWAQDRKPGSYSMLDVLGLDQG